MKNIYSYDVGDIVDDLVCIGVNPPEKGSGKSTTYDMRCLKCGRKKVMLGATLARKSGTTHKACGKGIKTLDPKFHRHWCSMRTRTTNPNYEHWDDYGGRGISSEAFKNFIDFYDAMYESYKRACKKIGVDNVSLDRKNPNKNYTKSNCRWVHIDEQKANQRKTFKGVVIFPDGTRKKFKSLMKFCEKHDLNYSCMHDLMIGRLKSYKGITGYLID